jgi:hypothetical protein
MMGTKLEVKEKICLYLILLGIKLMCKYASEEALFTEYVKPLKELIKES